MASAFRNALAAVGLGKVVWFKEQPIRFWLLGISALFCPMPMCWLLNSGFLMSTTWGTGALPILLPLR